MSEYYGVTTPTNDFLAHYGIKGMRWGVRKYLDNNGRLTDKGLARYGKNPTKRSSARKLKRDFNRLDTEYGNIRAENIDVKRGNEWPYRTDVTWEIHKLPKNQKMKIYNNRMKGIKSLQKTILDKAKKNGYDIQLSTKRRLGSSVKDIQGEMNSIYGVSYAASHAADNDKYYDSQRVKIKRKRR